MQTGRQFQLYLPNDPDNSGPPVDENIIYRSAAIGGRTVIPALRRIARPAMSGDSIPGAAQVSLAKLGDKRALMQIEHELKQPDPVYGWFAPGKLRRIGNDEAVVILMNYFVQRSSDNSRLIFLTDTYYDPLVYIMLALEPIVQDPPAPFSTLPSDVIDKWVAWWGKNKAANVAWSVHENDLQDPNLRCLARKINWGYLDAILDLATHGGPQIVPILRSLADVGDKTNRTASFDTVRGHAQTALATLGDSEEFSAIVRQLDTADFRDAITKLQIIGGRKAIGAMISAFDSPNFLADYKDVNTLIQRRTRDRNALIVRALVKMVVSPPDVTGSPESKGKWVDWWNKNRDTAQFAPRPVYE